MSLPKRIVLWLSALAMMIIGVGHFADPEPFVRIVPEALPSPRLLVYVSGFFEICGGLGLLIPRTRRLAAWGLVALFVAVFPANVNMAINEIQLTEGGDMPAWAMWARLPLQAVFIGVAYGFTRPDGAGETPKTG
jgi:uncharacterized membrane protein